MAKGVKRADNGETNPEAEERKRLKMLAHTNNLLSSAQAKDFTPLTPSKTVAKHHGTDILKKSQRKNRYLFSFPGLLAPINGGKIGELTNLGSKNPTLYLDFPQGRMKLFGTIVYPNNRYLSLQFSKGGKNVMCEDCFDTMIMFSDACWVGKKDENPQETRLPFPVELYENTSSEHDFQAGAGSTAVKNHNYSKVIRKFAEEEQTNADADSLSPARDDKMNKSVDITPVRQSERTAGKRFKFTEVSSGDDSPVSADEISGSEEAAKEANETSFHQQDVDPDVEMEGAFPGCTSAQDGTVKEQLQQFVVSDSSRKKFSQNSNGKLVQTTISTLLKKVNSKARQSSSAKKKVSFDEKAGSRSARTKKKIEISDEGSDDIEEFSSPSQDTDEDWAA